MTITVSMTCDGDGHEEFKVGATVTQNDIKERLEDGPLNVFRALAIATERHFRRYHPGFYPPDAVGDLFASCYREGRDPTSEEVWAAARTDKAAGISRKVLPDLVGAIPPDAG